MRRLLLLSVLLLTIGSWSPAFGQAVDEARELEKMVADHPRRALRQAEDWLGDAARMRDKALALKAQRLLVMAHESLEDSERLRQAAAKGLALARELAHREAEAELLAGRAAAEALDGNYPESARLYEEAERHALTHGLETVAAKMAVGRGYIYLTQGRIAEALSNTMRAYSHFESRKDTFGMANALSALANIYSREAASPTDLAKAADYHQRSLDLSGPDSGRSDRATDLFNLGSVHLRLKAWDRARNFFDKSLALSRELDDAVGAAYAYHRIGILEKEQGRPKEALEMQDKALVTFKDTGDRVMEFRTQLARAEALSLLERRRESLDTLTRARGIAERLKSPRLDSTLHEVAGEIHARFGDWERAFRDLKLLRDAERRREDAARTDQVIELQARFDTKQKEAENALLRSRQTESEARRLALVLALVLSLVVLGGLAFALAGYVMRHRRMTSLALRDDLTGLPNRRSILEYGRLQVRRNRKSGEPLTIALIDLDHFKRVNDELGHAVGDGVLRGFAESCARQLRSQDQLGRFGGEEFVLVMPGADLEQAPYVFERLRKCLNEATIPGFPEGRRLTFSMGAAEARSVADDLESLIQRADRALYRAKQSGRDRYETG